MSVEIQAVDLFCGAGGLTRGLLNAGIRVRAGFDIDAVCAFPYNVNNDGAVFIERNVVDLHGDDIHEILSENGIRLISGCAPCQPFSKYRQGQDTKKDQKWGLLYHFERIVREAQPDLVTMENVPELARHEVFADFKTSLENLDYHVDAKVVDCRGYGVPQYRLRLVLVASRLGPIAVPPPTFVPGNFVTVEQAIGHLPPIQAGQQHPEDPLHIASGLSKLNLQRIRQSKPGGTWRDWEPEIVAICHRKASGKTYASVYGRMKWEEPAPTMTTQCYGFGNGRFGHPDQDRAISLREAAIFQSFPEAYRFVPENTKVAFTSVGRMIGNAVPVKLGEAIGNTLMQHAERYIRGKEVLK